MANIERRGPGQFRVRIRRSGLPAQVKTFPTRALAESWAREIEGRIEAGTLPSAEAARLTLADALERYAREITPGKRGAGQERRRITAWRAHPLGKLALGALRGADLADYRDARLTGIPFDRFRAARLTGEPTSRRKDDPKPVGPDTVRLELAILSNLYTIARTEWGLENLGNPIRNIRKPKPGAARTRRLVGDEEARLVKAAGPLLRPAIELALATAMRRGELASARWEHIDLARRVITVPMTKNGDPRSVPLSPEAIATLRALPRRLDGWLFGLPATVADDLSQDFAKLTQGLGIAGLRFHDLRHEAISRLFEKGLNVAEVAAISGHKTWSQLRRYTQLRAEQLAERLHAA